MAGYNIYILHYVNHPCQSCHENRWKMALYTVTTYY